MMLLPPPRYSGPDYGSKPRPSPTAASTSTSTSNTSDTLIVRMVRSQRSDGGVKSDPLFETNWIFYAEIGACLLLGLIVIVILISVCCRWCRERREQEVSDGGAPPSPGHNHTYVIEIRADEASPTFDVNQTIIRMELLDIEKQYLTSVAVPCFVLKFKTNEEKGSPPSPSASKLGAPQRPVGALSRKAQINRSMTSLMERWSNTLRSTQISFFLIKRLPMKNFGAIRVTHDCFNRNAYMTLKHVIVREDATKSIVKIDLQGKQIKAMHPCPPTGLQVFAAERSIANQQV